MQRTNKIKISDFLLISTRRSSSRQLEECLNGFRKFDNMNWKNIAFEKEEIRKERKKIKKNKKQLDQQSMIPLGMVFFHLHYVMLSVLHHYKDNYIRYLYTKT